MTNPSLRSIWARRKRTFWQVAAEVAPYDSAHARPKERYVSCVPLLPLKAAAGAFGDLQHVQDDDGLEWVVVESRHRLRPGMFIGQVVGKSMEPAVPDGAYCLFAAPVTGTREGKTVLVQLRDATDPEPATATLSGATRARRRRAATLGAMPRSL